MTWLHFACWTAFFCICVPSPGFANDVTQQIERFNAHATYPIPALTESQRQALQEGKLVRIRVVPTREGQAYRGIGLKIIDQPRAQLWAGAVDEHMSSKGTASEVEMPREGKGKRWYQRLWLPWPFAQRHWVIDVQDTHSLAVATQGTAWEHYWVLSDNGPALAEALIAAGKVEGVTSKAASGFVYTPVNQGAYFAIALSDRQTLWGFHASTIVGGNISDKMIANFTMMQLKGIFQDIEERGLKSREHYVTGHAPIEGGDGAMLPVFPH